MSSKYTVLIIEDSKIDKKILQDFYQSNAVVFLAALPESYFDDMAEAVGKIQDEAAEAGEL